jgi:hypothetical protein
MTGGDREPLRPNAQEWMTTYRQHHTLLVEEALQKIVVFTSKP